MPLGAKSIGLIAAISLGVVMLFDKVKSGGLPSRAPAVGMRIR